MNNNQSIGKTDSVTVVISEKPERVAKEFRKLKGNIVKTAVGNITAGTAHTKPVPTAHAMADLLAKVTEREDAVVCPGVWLGSDDHEKFKIVTERELAEMMGSEIGKVKGGVLMHNGEPVAARLKRGIVQCEWLLLDADNPPGIPAEWAAMTIPERLAMWDQIVPGISACERIELRASSARVINGNGSKPKTHAWIRVSNPEKIAALKAYISVEMVNQGLSFKFEKKSHLDRKRTVGVEARSVFDLAVFDTGRLVFCSKPILGEGMDGYAVDDAGIEIVNEGNGVLDISWVKAPTNASIAEYKMRTGIELKFSGNGSSISTESFGQLTPETEIVVRGNTRTLSDWAKDMRPGDKLRCESPFRESSSEAAFIRIRDDGEAIVHDVGNCTTYHMSRAKLFDIDQLFDDVVLTNEDTAKMENAEFIIKNLIVRGHVHYIAAPGNGGKTTILIHLCPEMVYKGFDIFYINVDGNADDLKRHQAHAIKHGYKVICPDAKTGGKSVKDVMAKLEMLANSDTDLSSTVFIFDTLKKFLDVINKAEAKAFNNLMRMLSQKGMTIILLGHTNKHNDIDGELVYEGTSDMRNDVDNLIYFKSAMNERDKILEITTKPDKVRATFEPRSFRIHLAEERRVEEVGYVVSIVGSEVRTLIETYKEGIVAGKHSQKDLIEFARERSDFGEKKLKGLLKRIAGMDNSPIRSRHTGYGKELHYYLTEDALEEVLLNA